MKKFAALLLMILAMLMLTGCGREEVPFSAKNYEADQVTAVTVDVRDREIRVVPSEDERVHIDYFDSEKVFFTISQEEGRLTMMAASDKQWKDYIGRDAPREHRIITLRLPQGTLEKLTLATTNENISLCPLAAQAVELTANGGNIAFENLDVGASLSLDVKNGDITGSILGGWDDFDITCTTKKGESNLPARKEGGEKTLSVCANNGDVEVALAK